MLDQRRCFGGRENLEALDFLRRLNESVYADFPDIQTVAEESTAWPMVSRPTYLGGLGFGMKWDMGWMHDTLRYFERQPIHRQHHHVLTFRMVYAFTENFMPPLSHDEVVHGKGSLLDKMPGDEWQKMATLRCLLGYMWAQPGKKLLFMGGEFGKWPAPHSLILTAQAGVLERMRMSKAEVTLTSLVEELVRFRDDRDWKQFHTPRNLAAAISIESGELLETMLWKSDREVEVELQDPKFKRAIGEELADVMMFSLLLAHALGVDPAEIIRAKLCHNAVKYPVELAKGTAVKYSILQNSQKRRS